MENRSGLREFSYGLDEANHRLFVGCCLPPTLVVLNTESGDVVAKVDISGDADDVFVDAKRHRVYVICGAGLVDVFEERAGSYQRIGDIGTAPGARTGLLVPEMDRLFVAVRAAGKEPAAIWVFRPMP